MNQIIQETSPKYILSEVIQIPALFTIWESLSKKMSLERVGESNIEELLKGVVN